MAAMAPALTDAPAEAHRIRFKLAPPSSDLSPSASATSENNSNATNILLCHHNATSTGGVVAASNGTSSNTPSPTAIVTPKRRITNGADHHHHHHHHRYHHHHHPSAQDKGLLRRDVSPLPVPVPKPPALGKLQPLVASYLCSDVTTVPSSTQQAKESLKSLQQGCTSLIQQTVLKTHHQHQQTLQHHQGVGLFAATAGGEAALLRKRQALEITGGQLQGLLSGGGERTSPTPPGLVAGAGSATTTISTTTTPNNHHSNSNNMPINGLAKKMATNATTGNAGVVNGGGSAGKAVAGVETPGQAPKGGPVTRNGGGLSRVQPQGRGVQQHQNVQQQQQQQPATQVGGGVEDPPQPPTSPSSPIPSLSLAPHNNGTSPPAQNCQSAATTASSSGQQPEGEQQQQQQQQHHPSSTVSTPNTTSTDPRPGLPPGPPPASSSSSSSCLAPRPPSPATVALQLQERTQHTQRRQADIEGRLRRLRKRLQVVQAKQVERHVQQQVSGLVEKTTSCSQQRSAGGGSMGIGGGGMSGRLASAASAKASVSDPWGRHVDPSTSALVASAAGVSASTSSPFSAASTSCSGGASSLMSSMSSSGAVASFLKSGAVPADLERLHLSGSTFLRSAEAAFDSDATESSSGGESDVEQDQVVRADPDKRHVKLWRRAEGRYAVERAAIISHWNWLQAHVSDLEYRIRQQAEIHRQIRASKGAVELGDPAPSEPSTQMELSPRTTPEDVECAKAETPAAEASRTRTCNTLNGIPNSAEESPDQKPLVLTPDPTCVAARTRPLLSCRRRRLVHPNAVPNLSGKVQRSCVSGGCRVNSSCLTCGGVRPPQPVPTPLELSLAERLAHLDNGIHPILSLPSDTKLSMHVQRLLKAQGQSSRSERQKPLKRHSLKHKISLGGLRLPRPSSSSSPSARHKHKLGNAHMAAVRLAHHRKSRLERSHHGLGVERSRSVSKMEARTPTHTPCRPGRLHERSQSRKRPRELSADRNDGLRQQLESISPSVSVSSGPPSTPSPLTRQLSLPSEMSTPLGFGSQPGSAQPIRRRRGESSFDINNIVIPMSVAATTRVEKLQYKEILTPSWRKVNVLDEPTAEDEEDVEVEDLSDMAFVQHHLPLEEQERSRWSWRALAPATRRGSRLFKSLDGRSTPLLGGTNPSTPQPSSPDISHFHVLQDYGPLASPMSPPSPDTPSSRDSHTRCSTPDFTYEERTVVPWDRRSFPLSEDPIIVEEEEPSGNEGESPPHTSGRMRAESECDPLSP
ncbi:KAT8 regulatory NSL complex subunit 1 isoform X1 [Engraulis encrasicolus]|uniref:KAT8 regulatory NSL complex subunit 1 isoform X1 n=1 Tax=Engraulis encrasicolus TaxID=184585 RepID=UPI002FD13D0F